MHIYIVNIHLAGYYDHIIIIDSNLNMSLMQKNPESSIQLKLFSLQGLDENCLV